MRATQTIGLTDEARDWLSDNVALEPVSVCPACGHKTGGGLVSAIYDRETGVQAGMFDDGPMLFEYELKDGKKVREIVQEVPWSSGPCIFLCLEDEDGKRMFEWPEEELNNC